ncbi:F-box/LRR-repeat protein 7 [Orchesella cincta]|uniref:F-box/LRR-repeat protein 7 n=1 Tax=Orchesella cincta TaxID=48709 RepID=A0A1D2N1K5_ORCCI|nr:F-box/LRR-repeat protein 7 [Orchesella cincta]
MTGFSKEILDEMDIMNPFQATRERHKTESHRKGYASIRNLKSLTHLSLDDQPACTDFSIIFGVLKLQQLQVLSCKKWKVTDVALRALADILPSLRIINTDGCVNVSKYALDYFNESRTRKPPLLQQL